MNKAIVQQWMKTYVGQDTLPEKECKNKSQQIGKGLHGAADQPYTQNLRSEILQFTGSPFALEIWEVF